MSKKEAAKKPSEHVPEVVKIEAPVEDI